MAFQSLPLATPASFTHVDPFEDTESHCRRPAASSRSSGFTHVDPFEDTESWRRKHRGRRDSGVSPTSIRSRILKAKWYLTMKGQGRGFTHVDPFEDTERWSSRCRPQPTPGVSPTSIRSRILKETDNNEKNRSRDMFHPRRSVRGY